MSTKFLLVSSTNSVCEIEGEVGGSLTNREIGLFFSFAVEDSFLYFDICLILKLYIKSDMMNVLFS